MKKSTILLAALVALAVVVYSQRAALLERLMSRGMETRMSANVIGDLQDGLHLALCGAGGPMPAPTPPAPAWPSSPATGCSW